MYRGSYVAIVTPFKDDILDENGLRKNLGFLASNDSAGIVACATTGESPSLSEAEYDTVIRICAEEVKGKIPVIAGAGTNSTTKTVKLMNQAREAGANGLLVVTPYYNKPPQDGLYQHYRAISAETDLPIIIYNVPGRTGVNILPRTVARLADECRNITAIKEASGNLDQVSELAGIVPEGFDILSGDDSLTLPMLALGAKGVISVAANIIPKDIADMCRLYFEGYVEHSRKMHLRMFQLVKALFLETNPIPVKKALELMSMPAGKPRSPLSEMNPANTELLKKNIIEYGIKI